MCMKDYDVAKMEFQDLILVVASTFGSGDPPDNGEKFYKSLKKRFVEQGNTPNIASWVFFLFIVTHLENLID